MMPIFRPTDSCIDTKTMRSWVLWYSLGKTLFLTSFLASFLPLAISAHHLKTPVYHYFLKALDPHSRNHKGSSWKKEGSGIDFGDKFGNVSFSTSIPNHGTNPLPFYPLKESILLTRQGLLKQAYILHFFTVENDTLTNIFWPFTFAISDYSLWTGS